MKQWQEVSLSTNYTIIKADNALLDLILIELWREIPHPAVGRSSILSPEHERTIIDALKHYNWKYKRFLKIRSGHNIVPLVLRETLASMIVGNTVTPTFIANYLALGDGITTPTNNDVALANETLRWTFSNRFATDNVAYLDKFFSSADVGGNSYLEAWIFVDGTASADTWYLLSRILIDEVISVNETLSFNCTFTIS